MPSQRLTDRTIRSLRVEKRTEFFDSVLPGLGIRIGPSGDKTFFVRYRSPNGHHRQRRFTVGRYGVISLAEARDQGRRLLAAVARGEDPQEEARSLTVGEVVELFLERHADAHLKPSTAAEYRRSLEKDVVPRWGDWDVREVERRHVNKLLDDVAIRRGSPIGANRLRAVVSSLFSWALTREFVEHNPVHGTRRPGRENRRDRVLTHDEIRTLWQVLEGEAEPLRSLVRFLLLTGQRSGETRRARWADMDFTDAAWSIPADERKNRRPHRVPLNVQAVNILDGLRRRSEGEFVFASPSTRSDGGPIRWVFYANQRLRKACGFEFRLHDLRRTCASGLAELGVDRNTISKILGHRSADAGVIGVYDRYDRKPEMRQALVAWGDRVEQIVTGKAAADKVVGRIG